MKRRISSSVAALLVGALSLTGCGSDGTGPGNNLSQAEAMMVFSEILSAISVVGFDQGAAADGIGALVTTITINESAPCNGGGVIEVVGSLKADTDDFGNGSYEYTFVETPVNCVVSTGSGASYRVNGSPNIQMSGAYDFAFNNNQLSGHYDWRFSGGMSWTALNGGANGSCTMDLVYKLNLGISSGSVTGHICGHNVTQQY